MPNFEYKIGEIFGEISNKLQSGYSLRDVIDKVDELRFWVTKKSMNLVACTKTKSRIWAMLAVMVVSTTRLDP